MKYRFFLFVLLAGCQNKNTILPHIKNVVEAVYASGFVISQDEYQIFSQVDGYVVEIMAHEGDVVKKDQPILIIDGQQQSARYRIAKENYTLASKNNRVDSPMLMEATAALERAQIKLRYDSVNLIRFQNLWKNNATKKNEYDQALLAYNSSQIDYQLQQSRYQKLKDQLQNELISAQNNLNIAANESGRYVVKSNFDGRIYKIAKETGELVRRTEALVTFGRNQFFYLQLSVDELDIRKIKEGQKILVRVDAYGDQVFEAAVTKIYPMVNQREQAVRVDAYFSQPLPDGFSGLAVEANIVIREKEKALVIPKSFLYEGDSVRTTDGKKRKIVRGLETLDEVEVIEGIDATTKLMK